MKHIFGALIALALAVAPAGAQEPRPPDVPLWSMAANGDAVQTDLGFVLPPRIGTFERRGFTSTRPDGGSVMTWYESPDGRTKLRILLQLRPDVFGLPLPGADGVERNWRFIERIGDAEFPSAPRETIIDGPLLWGTPDRPNGRIRIVRFTVAGGPVSQGMWYRNIGMWAVVAVAQGPDQGEVERAGAAAMMLPWPRAPLTAELRASASQFLRGLRDCPDFDRAGTGRPAEPGAAIKAMIGLGLGVTFLDTARNIPHPVLEPDRYCRIETFQVGDQEVIGLGWQGDLGGYPAARYAFMTRTGSRFFQFESFFSGREAPPEQRPDIERLVWLSASTPRRIAALRVLTDWPSYDQAKALVIAADDGPPEIVAVSHPAAGLVIDADPARTREAR
ncbi:MAG: hypothetical protein QOC65_772 [Sphingomonadales bacterium]|nr:hypothetical protein [Sphingomonadales bacterium]